MTFFYPPSTFLEVAKLHVFMRKKYDTLGGRCSYYLISLLPCILIYGYIYLFVYLYLYLKYRAYMCSLTPSRAMQVILEHRVQICCGVSKPHVGQTARLNIKHDTESDNVE